jgi:hypothetical protein
MGIPHFSALSDKRKRIFLEEPGEFTYQEKVDGSNLKFKLDRSFPWAMRKTTNGQVYTKPEDWGTDFWVTGFRASHQALIDVLPDLIDQNRSFPIYNGGETLDMEMLFGDTPNTILYNDKVNHLVVFSPEPRNISKYFIGDAQVTLDDVPTTPDGFTIERVSKTYDFTITPLETEQGIALYDNNEYLFRKANELPLAYVSDLLVSELTPVKSSFATVLDTRIEGLVFRHSSGWMFKLVDRNWFTAQNTKNYLVRNQLFKSPRGHKKSVMDTFWTNVAEGKPLSYALDKTSEQLDIVWKQYVDVDHETQAAHIHKRNLEAFASIRHQLNDYAENGIPTK